MNDTIILRRDAQSGVSLKELGASGVGSKNDFLDDGENPSVELH
jgi:hypothetical protein